MDLKLPLSDITQAGRWDAGFHLFRQEYQSYAAELEKSISDSIRQEHSDYTDEQVKSGAKEYVATMLKEVPLEGLKVIEPLARGSQHTRYGLEKAIDEYPFLSLAAIKKSDIGLQMEEDAQKKIDLARRLKP